MCSTHIGVPNLEHSGLWLWRLMPHSGIFQLYRSGQLYWCWKPEKPEKTTSL